MTCGMSRRNLCWQSRDRHSNGGAIVRADRMMHVVYERANVAEMTRLFAGFRSNTVAERRWSLVFCGHGTSAYVVAIVPSNQDASSVFGSSRKASDLEELSKVTGVGIDAAEGTGRRRRSGIQPEWLSA